MTKKIIKKKKIKKIGLLLNKVYNNFKKKHYINGVILFGLLSIFMVLFVIYDCSVKQDYLGKTTNKPQTFPSGV